jgi:hypothetical protein
MTKNLFTTVPDSGERPWVLAIDFGTTATTAVTADSSGAEILEVDGARAVPSAVLQNADGELVAGKAAADQAVVHPERVERTPKRSIGDEHVVLGNTPVRVVDAVAAVLSLVFEEACRRRGGSRPTHVCLTHPASWEQRRQQALLEAARIAGLPGPVLMAEPVAAAVHLAGDRLPVGAVVAVYDLGGGTFDAAVLRRTEHDFELAGAPGGVDHLGGEDFDRALYGHLGDMLAGEDAEAWEALQTSEERQWRRASAELLAQSCRAKEALSRQGSYTVYVPAPVDRELRVTRDELDGLIRDDISTTVEELAATMARAKVPANKLSGVYLVGGSSRLPLVASIVAERLGRVPETRDDPKAVVALGAAEALIATLAETKDEDGADADADADADATKPVEPTPAPVSRRRSERRSRRLAQAGSTVLVLALLAGGALKAKTGQGNHVAAPKPTTTTTAAASAQLITHNQPGPTTTLPPTTIPPVLHVQQAPSQGVVQQRGSQVSGPAVQQRSAAQTQPPPAPGPSGPSGPALNSVYQVGELSAGFAWHGNNRSDGSDGFDGHMFWTYVTPSQADACHGTTIHDWGTWQTSLPTAGHYRLEVWIPHYDATTTNAQYIVHTTGGTQTVALNQNAYSQAWVPLGTFTMSTGQLDLTDITGEPCVPNDGYAQRHIGFDDVRWVYVGG